MATRKKTPAEKRDAAPAPAVRIITGSKNPNFPPGRMLLASPLEIAMAVEQIPEGRVITLDELRSGLARKWEAGYTCPLTTGIFLRIAAEASDEEGPDGRNTPYWRVVRGNGRLIDRLPGGEAAQRQRLAREGVQCVAAGKGWRVASLSECSCPFPG